MRKHYDCIVVDTESTRLVAGATYSALSKVEDWSKVKLLGGTNFTISHAALVMERRALNAAVAASRIKASSQVCIAGDVEHDILSLICICLDDYNNL